MVRPLRLPRCVIGIAKPTAQIAATGAYKGGRHANQPALALDRIEDFRKEHDFMIQDISFPRGSVGTRSILRCIPGWISDTRSFKASSSQDTRVATTTSCPVARW